MRGLCRRASCPPSRQRVVTPAPSESVARLAEILRQSPGLGSFLAEVWVEGVVTAAVAATTVRPDSVAAVLVEAEQCGLARDLDPDSLRPRIEHRFVLGDAEAFLSWLRRAEDA